MSGQVHDERMVSRILDALFPGEYSIEARMKVHDYLWGVLEHCDARLWDKDSRSGTPRELYDQSFKAGMEKALHDMESILLQQPAEEAALRTSYDRPFAAFKDHTAAIDALYETLHLLGDTGEGFWITAGDDGVLCVLEYDIRDQGESDGATWLRQYVYSMAQGKEIPVWKKI